MRPSLPENPCTSCALSLLSSTDLFLEILLGEQHNINIFLDCCHCCFSFPWVLQQLRNRGGPGILWVYQGTAYPVASSEAEFCCVVSVYHISVPCTFGRAGMGEV